MISLPAPDSWRALAACKDSDTDIFYPGQGASCAPAKAICATCVSRAACLAFALDNCEMFGIWGGLSERQRRRMRHDRRAA